MEYLERSSSKPTKALNPYREPEVSKLALFKQSSSLEYSKTESDDELP